MIADFKEFLLKQNALALAIGVIIGAAVSKIVSAIVDDVLNPILGLFLPGGSWRDARIILARGVDATGKPTEAAILYGHLLGALVDFLIIGIVIYFVAKAFIPKTGETKPETKECPECRSVIPIAARRCQACTQVVP